MTIRLYADEFRCAIYEEAPGGGDPLDPASPRNRPVLEPMNWLGNIRFHSDLAYFGIAAKDMNRIVSHPVVPAASRSVTRAVTVLGQELTHEHVLVVHNLGYVPKFYIIYDGRLIPHGTATQNLGDGRKRYVAAFATSSEIRLFEIGYSTGSALPAVSRTYQVIVFQDQDEDPTGAMLDLQPGIADFGRGRFQAAQPHLRADGMGDVQWPIPTSPTAAVRNGALRVYQPDGGFVDDGSFDGSLSPPTIIMTSAGV